MILLFLRWLCEFRDFFNGRPMRYGFRRIVIENDMLRSVCGGTEMATSSRQWRGGWGPVISPASHDVTVFFPGVPRMAFTDRQCGIVLIIWSASRAPRGA